MAFDGLAWNRERHRRFQAQHGYSLTIHYATGGLRQRVLERDGYKCVDCGMHDSEHRQTWGIPITIDHIDKDRRHNTMENLQTMCRRCHSRKDITIAVPVIPEFRDKIMAMRAKGYGSDRIAHILGFGRTPMLKWVRRWERPEIYALKSRKGSVDA